MADRQRGAAAWSGVGRRCVTDPAIGDVLLALTASPIVAVNRAVAVAMRDGPEAGLALLDELAATPQLRDYEPFETARADLRKKAGRTA